MTMRTGDLLLVNRNIVWMYKPTIEIVDMIRSNNRVYLPLLPTQHLGMYVSSMNDDVHDVYIVLIDSLVVVPVEDVGIIE